ncbi:helix-turn-helix transcriptional regulator [Micromonospora sp. NPDC005305]|uniref:helix-turn-helix domain-containing protein n=1 Tax=Micromonospora sp. NPDC005305 TaxID=3156875 RepID=UPI0033AC9952
MRGRIDTLTTGERVAWYRRRRGLSQEVLAGLIGRTADWLGKIENNRIELDRLSVIKSLAEVLDVSLGDLLGEPSLVDRTGSGGIGNVQALRAALLNYRVLAPLPDTVAARPLNAPLLWQELSRLWSAYQDSRFRYVTARLPDLLQRSQAAVDHYDGAEQDRARRVLGLAYQLAATQLTKLGERDLAWIAADRGLAAVHATGDPVVVGSLVRSVGHALLAIGRHAEAVRLTEHAADHLTPHLRHPTPALLSVYGTLHLSGSMAAARAGDAATTRAFLAEAGQAAARLGTDANHLWTAFGPTNVAIHRVAAAAELGDIQVAVEIGPTVDTSGLPIERRVRHALEVARAYSARNRLDDAQAVLLDAEHMAPEQVRHHFLSRQLAVTWIRQQRRRPSASLVALARRLGVLD